MFVNILLQWGVRPSQTNHHELYLELSPTNVKRRDKLLSRPWIGRCVQSAVTDIGTPVDDRHVK